MGMHRLEYVRLNRKDQFKNMRGTTPEFAMLRRQRSPQRDFECLPM